MLGRRKLFVVDCVLKFGLKLVQSLIYPIETFLVFGLVHIAKNLALVFLDPVALRSVVWGDVRDSESVGCGLVERQGVWG